MDTNELLSLIQQGVVKQAPLEHSANKIRYGHPDGYFLNANGLKMSLRYTPTKPSLKNGKSHSEYPKIDDNILCHILMALTFYGERPTFIDRKGKPYVGICHHLVPNPLDYRPENLLCWLTREQHGIADARQKVMRTIVPDGNLNGFDYAILRELQDPRSMSDADFDARMEYLRHMRKCGFDPRIFTAEHLHEFFSMPFEEFERVMLHHKNDE